MKAREPALTRKAWLDAGQKVLMDEGVRSLRLRPLAQSLGISTGSFYHHFENFDVYLGALARYYSDEQFTENLSLAVLGTSSPRERLDALTRLAQERGWDRIGLAMRAWARSDARAEEAVRKLDKTVLDFLVACFLELGFDNGDAHLRAYLMLALGSNDVALPRKAGSRVVVRKGVLDLMCRR